MQFKSIEYLNRKVTPLPERGCIIEIIKQDIDGTHLFTCTWVPVTLRIDADYKPEPGYLGTARVIAGKYNGIGFHVWEQNDYEFLYYRLVE